MSFEKTEHLRSLLIVPPDLRDEAWLTNFLFVAPDAVLHLAREKTVTGPDGFPYLEFDLPVQGERFLPATIRELSAWAVENPSGMVINYPVNKTGWVFRYGDIWDLFENGAMALPLGPKPRTKLNGFYREIVQESRQITLHEPRHSMLPSYVRGRLREFISMNLGVKRAISCVFMHDSDFEPSESLVISIYQEDFNSKELYEAALGALQWFLPMRVGVASCSSLEPDMVPL